METEKTCTCLQVTDVKLANLGDDLRELKDRVQRLEMTIARGVMLLVANLVAVVVTLFQQIMRS
ncbi:MAG: hypothetical protein HUU46_02775 [Candidatus Hydrogenedentes bacterium]|nr:hypothetical protein [Candidatus Hydrogenedentota bacterium]